MKKIALLALMQMAALCMQKSEAPNRPGTPMPKAPNFMPAARLTPPSTPASMLKMATCGINIWCNEKCDPERWAYMVELYRRLEDEPFNQKALLNTILEEISLSENKKGNGIWGGLSFTYIKDSQKLDKENDSSTNQ